VSAQLLARHSISRANSARAKQMESAERDGHLIRLEWRWWRVLISSLRGLVIIKEMIIVKSLAAAAAGHCVCGRRHNLAARASGPSVMFCAELRAADDIIKCTAPLQPRPPQP